MSVLEKKYILAIDSGGSSIRALLFNHAGQIVARAQEKTPPFFIEGGGIEHDPEDLWKALLTVVHQIIDRDDISASEIAGIGITNQRASFCMVDRKTGVPLTNLYNWADVRAHAVAKRMNSSFKWRALVGLGKIAGKITNSAMMQTTAMLDIQPEFDLAKLPWLFEHETIEYHGSQMSGKELLQRCKADEVMFCTLDTWFVYKLTGNKNHVTDYTNASGTAMFNPFDLKWNNLYGNMFKIPMKMFPKVLDTNGDFGQTNKELFGVEIPIGAVVGDQMASLFGHTCFTAGETKISQGSGAFVDMCVGPKPKLSKKGLFPLIAWMLDGKITYMIEGQVTTAGTLIDWLGDGIGVSDSPKVLNEFAAQTEDTEGVIVIPTPSGINFPYFNPRTRATIFGLSLSTHRRHVCRAVLEGLAMRLYDILEGIEHDTKVKLKSIKVDGGVSQSDIQLQCLADFADVQVERAPEPDMTSTGAAYFAGLSVGFWRDLAELKGLQQNQNYELFVPKMDAEKRRVKIMKWKQAVKAVLSLDK